MCQGQIIEYQNTQGFFTAPQDPRSLAYISEEG